MKEVIRDTGVPPVRAAGGVNRVSSNQEGAGKSVADDGRFNNYHLGGFVILLGLLFFGCSGSFYSERHRTATDPALIGLAIVAMGAWTLVREFRRRRRDRW